MSDALELRIGKGTLVVQFVITGTGRSGTGYASRLLTNAGLRCGHEDVFRVTPGIGDPHVGRRPRRPWRYARRPLDRWRETRRRNSADLIGDASWMAVPRLDRFDGAAFLQLRDPLKVISSFQGTRFFMPERHKQRQTQFAMHYFDPVGDPLLDAMRWWVIWNERAASKSTIVYRLEDLDADLLERMFDLIGVRPTASAEDAISDTATNVNSATSRGMDIPDLSWSDLPGGEPLDHLRRAAERWGYPVE